MTEEFLRLKSGSDIRGVAVETPEGAAALTPAVGRAIGRAFACWLAEAGGKQTDALTVAVGRDSRVSGEPLLEAIAAGMHAEGVRVLDCGLCTTPAMFMATVLLSVDAAVMVTASHLPWPRNGYKFFTPQGGLDGDAIISLLNAAAAVEPTDALHVVEKTEFLSQYAAYLSGMVKKAMGGDRPLQGLHIVVDAGNGAGGFYADMLAGLGADVSGSQFLEPDGYFPNHIPNPEDKEAMRSISGAVREHGADLGVIFDTDCDRAALVDAQGREINRNRLIALVTAMLLVETPGITVVSDSVTSAGLDAFVAGKGGTLHRYKRGYRNVIDEALRLNAQGIDCPLAIETSGHAALRENRFLDDGMYLVTRLMIEAARMRAKGRLLVDLIEGLQEPSEAYEMRLPIQAEDFRAQGAEIIEAIVRQAQKEPGQRIDPLNREGARIQFGGPEHWALLRVSVHDPLLVINVESARQGGTRDILETLLQTLSRFPMLDTSPLRGTVK